MALRFSALDLKVTGAAGPLTLFADPPLVFGLLALGDAFAGAVVVGFFLFKISPNSSFQILGGIPTRLWFTAHFRIHPWAVRKFEHGKGRVVACRRGEKHR